MIYSFMRGWMGMDLDLGFALSAILLVMLLIFKFVKKKKVLFIVLAAFLTGIVICEALYHARISMSVAFYTLGAEYLLIPGSLAIITWLVVRRMREKKQRAAER
ncbi:MAG: hypothetical protein K2N94_11450 [Lachnospiraceae bacterium]|nr:hypothetical protein [Lachnospiraceae bacterium]